MTGKAKSRKQCRYPSQAPLPIPDKVALPGSADAAPQPAVPHHLSQRPSPESPPLRPAQDYVIADLKLAGLLTAAVFILLFIVYFILH